MTYDDTCPHGHEISGRFGDLCDVCNPPNPFCLNRSTAGDACGSCAGCRREAARLFGGAHESFTRNADGSRTCVDCGQTFDRADGAVMRSHRRRVHHEAHAVPNVCDA